VVWVRYGADPHSKGDGASRPTNNIFFRGRFGVSWGPGATQASFSLGAHGRHINKRLRGYKLRQEKCQRSWGGGGRPAYNLLARGGG